MTRMAPQASYTLSISGACLPMIPVQLPERADRTLPDKRKLDRQLQTTPSNQSQLQAAGRSMDMRAVEMCR